jgi:hypothetical protein
MLTEIMPGGDVEFGKCEICGKETNLQREYYYYGVECECHGPTHFEVVRHCKNCEPKEPKTTKITVTTDSLRRRDITIEQARNRIIDAFAADPDFRRIYVDNIACVIMDNIPGFKRNKEARDDIADKILKWILA